MILPLLVIAVVVLILSYTVLALQIVKEHEQGVVTRFGKFLAVHPAGLVMITPFVDQMRKVDLRTLVIIERIEPGTGKGRVQIWGASWPATSDDGNVMDPGTPIEVAAINGRTVVVRPTR